MEQNRYIAVEGGILVIRLSNILLSLIKVEVAEYWIADWRKKKIEIYVLNPNEATLDEMDYKLVNVITESNKEELEIKMFPNVKITFEQLFEGTE